MTSSLIILSLCAVAAYLIGSIPFGLIVTRSAGLGDVRKIGSGNIGATNVLRTGKKGLAAATLLLDASKGVLALWLCPQIAWALHGFDGAMTDGTVAAIGSRAALMLNATIVASIAVIVGHIFPLWLNFKGGKGVATLFGVAFSLALSIGLVCALVWVGVFYAKRISSLAAMCMLAAFAFMTYATNSQLWLVALVLPLMVAAKHHENIRRLIKGEELAFSSSKKQDEAKP